ncbi:imm11 family protein [Pyxidicoccus sp. 3LG]
MPPHAAIADYWAMMTDYTSAVIEKLPEGSPELYLMTEGISLADSFPAEGTIRFSDNFPDHRKVCDFMTCTLGVLIVSEKVKRVIEGQGVDNCEFFSLKMLDHKGKVASKEHYVCNVLGSEDAMDMERSEVVMDSILPTEVAFIHKLILKREAISPKARIFRIQNKLAELLLHDSLYQALQKEGVTGMRFFPADGWNGRDF